MSNAPQFPDPLGVREVYRPGATAHKAGPDIVRRVQALEQGAAGRPGPGVSNGSVPTSDASQIGGERWGQPAAPSELALFRAGGSAVLGMTMNPSAATATTTLNDGSLYLTAFYLPHDATLTGVWWVPSVTGAFTADNNNKIGLYTRSGTTFTRVAQSANDANTFKTTAATFSQKAFSSTYAATAGLYYVALLRNESASGTTPSVYCSASPHSILQRLDLASGSGMSAFVSTAQADLAASYAAATSSLANPILCGVY